MQFTSYRKLISVFIVISTLILVSAINIMVVSAACDVDGSSGNEGDSSNNNITCDATNNPSGSNVRGRGGDDTITVDTGATADEVRGNGGNDTIVLNGEANVVGGGGGEDTITINGTVNGNVNGGNDDDVLIIQGDANITGRINGGDGTDILRFSFALCPTDHDITAINNEIESSSAKDDITVNGVFYEWRNIETFEGNIVPENCIEVTNEILAEMGFTDGRLNGVMCPIWLSGDTMTVYDVAGVEEVTISQSSLTTAPATNTLLVQNSNNTVRVYQLTTGEVQVECDMWDSHTNSWKTDSYVFQHLADYNPYIIR